MKASWPTNGSVMILKASAENGASSAAGRSTCVLRLARVEADDRRDVERRRQVVDHRVEQRLHALVLEGRAADDRDERPLLVADRLDGAPADGRAELVLGDRLAVPGTSRAARRRPRSTFSISISR